MNPYKNLILIKGIDKTNDISHCSYRNGKYSVTFAKMSRTYDYAYRNVTWLRNPEWIDLKMYKISLENGAAGNIKRAIKFGDYIKLFYLNGFTKVYENHELKLNKAIEHTAMSKNVMDCFRLLAGRISLVTEDGIALMEKKYSKLGFIPNDSVLSSYLNPDKYPIKVNSNRQAIYPFGCNLSQKQAVSNALTHSISVIEGPPGTGKTQTILNIIANILLQNKTVAIVSNNNAATMNVMEKLQKYDMDYLAAYLGNSDNKKTFIKNQSVSQIEFQKVDSNDYKTLYQKTDELNRKIDKMMVLNNRLAELKDQLNQLKLEKKYFDVFYDESYGDNRIPDFKSGLKVKRLLKLWIEAESLYENESLIRLNMKQKLYMMLKYRIVSYSFIAQPIEKIIPAIKRLYYKRCIDEVNIEIGRIKAKLDGWNFEENLELLSKNSMRLLKAHLSLKYHSRSRSVFAEDDLWQRPNKVIEDYPVIMSTTFSIDSTLPDVTYDYVVVDEASQVDLMTSVLTMSKARNIVVVGDLMQLPNVVTKADKKIALDSRRTYALDDCYHYEKHSMLSSIIKRFESLPRTMLKEHYRCHPKIIQFCNKKFYNNQLVIMTEDSDETDTLAVYKTVKGNHARGHYNQRQIDEIIQSILPKLDSAVKPENLGIISPYRAQKQKLKTALDDKNIDVDTVHKFQGREKDNIIITTVDNQVTEFTDNPNMLNVAISRAKEKVFLVVSEDDANKNTNIGDFIRYIEYNNFEVHEGKVYSVFDLLYKDYAVERAKFYKRSKRVSDYDSENIVYLMLEQIISMDEFNELGILLHKPLHMIFKNMTLLDEAETKYVMDHRSHVDFIIYRKIDKSPYLAIEVDGYKYHNESTEQYSRDRMKDAIFAKYDLPLLRLSTVGSGEKEAVIGKLRALMG